MTNYLIAVCIEPDATPPTPDELAVISKDVEAVVADATAAGVWVFGGGLTGAATAKTVDATGGTPVVSDGPYAETKEYLNGFSIIDVASFDEALRWAERFAVACRVPQEVREILSAPAAG